MGRAVLPLEPLLRMTGMCAAAASQDGASALLRAVRQAKVFLYRDSANDILMRPREREAFQRWRANRVADSSSSSGMSAFILESVCIAAPIQHGASANFRAVRRAEVLV